MKLEPAGTARPNWELLAGVRFVLALVVLAAHTSYWLGDGNHEYYLSLSPAGAVLVFLMVSGYSMAASYEREPEHFFRRRFWRIAPLFTLANVLCLLPFALWGDTIPVDFYYTANAPTWLGALTQFLGLNPLLHPVPFTNGALWSLGVEIAFYTMVPMLARLRTAGVVALCTASGIMLLCTSIMPGFRAYGCTFWAFGLGWLVYRYDSTLLVKLAVVAATSYLSHRTGEQFAPITTALFAAFVVFNRQIQVPAKYRGACTFLGDLSFPLYVLHTPLLSMFALSGANTGVAVQQVFFVPIFAVSIAALIWVDRPLRKMGHRVIKHDAPLHTPIAAQVDAR